MFFAPFLVLHSIRTKSLRLEETKEEHKVQQCSVQNMQQVCFPSKTKSKVMGEKNKIDKRRNRRRLEVFTRSNTKQQLKVPKLKQTFQAAPPGGNTISVAVETNTGWTVKHFLCSGTNPGGRPPPAGGPQLKPSLESGADLKRTMSGLLPDGLKRHTQPSIQHVGAPGLPPEKTFRALDITQLHGSHPSRRVTSSNIPTFLLRQAMTAAPSHHSITFYEISLTMDAKQKLSTRAAEVTHTHIHAHKHTQTQSFYEAIT